MDADRFTKLEQIINQRFDNLLSGITETKDAFTSYSLRINEDVSQMRRVVIDISELNLDNAM